MIWQYSTQNWRGDDLSGRGVLIIGASSAIGSAIGAEFKNLEDIVIGVSRSRAPRRNIFDAHQNIDCSSSSGAQRAVNLALEVAGRIDVVVTGTSYQPGGSAHGLADEDWATVLDATLTAPFLVIRAALPQLRRGAAVVALGSVNSMVPAPGVSAYAAAKGGIDSLIRELAVEYGPAGIRFNVVAPGMIAGEALDRIANPEESDPAAGYPLGRIGQPDEVAAAVVFLASERASFITGVRLPVDGGFSVVSPAAFLRPDLTANFAHDEGS